MLHEQDPKRGGCPFRTFFDQTPDVLQRRYRLFDTLAVPLYPSPEHRKVSLRHALRCLGASEPGQENCLPSSLLSWAKMKASLPAIEMATRVERATLPPSDSAASATQDSAVDEPSASSQEAAHGRTQHSMPMRTEDIGEVSSTAEPRDCYV